MKTKSKNRRNKKAISRKPGPEYTESIKCTDCKKTRWVKPQDVHLAKRCKPCQAEFTKLQKRERMRDLRARRRAKAKSA